MGLGVVVAAVEAAPGGVDTREAMGVVLDESLRLVVGQRDSLAL
jgi:hypothetical protein